MKSATVAIAVASNLGIHEEDVSGALSVERSCTHAQAPAALAYAAAVSQ
jgi:hypothetical protein